MLYSCFLPSSASSVSLKMNNARIWISCLLFFVYSILFCLSGAFSFRSPPLVSTVLLRRSLSNDARHGWGHTRRSFVCSLSNMNPDSFFFFSNNDTTNSTTSSTTDNILPPIVPTTTDVLICGGGPTGLLASILLVQKFPKVRAQPP